MDDADRRALEQLKEMPGWAVLVGKVIPSLVEGMKNRLAHTTYNSLDEVVLDQTKIRFFERFDSMIDEFIHAYDER